MVNCVLGFDLKGVVSVLLLVVWFGDGFGGVLVVVVVNVVVIVLGFFDSGWVDSIMKLVDVLVVVCFGDMNLLFVLINCVDIIWDMDG